MPMKIVRNDITKIKCDAIVNAANSSLLGGGGVDGAIHKAAGKQLLSECSKLGGCKVGQAKITKGYNLPAKYVIHTVGPKWQGGHYGESELLASCYRECLRIALEYKCESIAFPLISTGVYGYPKEQGFKIAADTITDFLSENEMDVYIVVFDKESFKISEKLYDDITAYIDEKYVDNHPEYIMPRRGELEDSIEESSELSENLMMFDSDVQADCAKAPVATDDDIFDDDAYIDIEYFDIDMDGCPETYTAPKPYTVPQPCASSRPCAVPEPSKSYQPILPTQKPAKSLADIVNRVDESFSEMLLRKIDEKGMSDVECYKKANINRKLFSKIRSNPQYKPSKTTAIAFAVALELSLEETNDMLMKAGFALSHSYKFDIIIEYFIINKNYNINEINEALFAFDQSLLGV